MARNRHGTTGRFAPGKDLGTYRGQARHDASTEAIKTALHSDMNPLRKVTTTHGGQQSVSTDAGRKPHAHDCADGGCNKAANAAFNDAVQNPTPMTTDAARLVGAGIKLS
jgi:hypothetical protein